LQNNIFSVIIMIICIKITAILSLLLLHPIADLPIILAHSRVKAKVGLVRLGPLALATKALAKHPTATIIISDGYPRKAPRTRMGKGKLRSSRRIQRSPRKIG
jgi:hypothetical protein